MVTMEAADDYEALPSSSSMGDHMLAGACAGIMEHTIMYPVDCVKTRMQCLRPINNPNYSSVMQGLVRLLHTEGLRGSLRGIGAMVGGAGPAHAAYFGCYEYTKSYLRGTALGSSHAVPMIGGALATLLHDAVMTPADAVKQRLQIYNSPYHSSLDCIRRVCLTEGPHVLYRAYFTQLTMNIPYQALHFVCYEASQDFLNPSRSYLPWTHIVAGGLAGGLAAACSNPLDVCKTMLNTQDRCTLPSSSSSGSSHRQIHGLLDCVRLVYSLEGFRGFTRGLSARVLTAVPGTAVSWSIYEYFKWYLSDPTSKPPFPGSSSPPASSSGDMRTVPKYLDSSSLRDPQPYVATTPGGAPLWLGSSNNNRGGITCAASSSPLDENRIDHSPTFFDE